MKIILILFLGIFPIFASTLEIYSDKSILTKNIKENSFIVPFELDQKDLSINSNCNIEEISFGNKIEDEISLKKQSLQNKLKALKDSYEIIKNSNLNTINDIKNLSGILNENLTSQAEISKEIDSLSNEPAFYTKKVTIKQSCKNPKTTISYPLNDALFKTLNSVNFKDGKISIKQSLIISNLKENLDDVFIKIYPYSVKSSKTPGKFTPTFIYSEETTKVFDAPATMSIAKNDSLKASNLEVSQNQNKINFFEISKQHLKALKENIIILNSQVLDANLTNYIDAYSGSKAYIAASFSPKNDINEALTQFFLNDVFVQNSYESKISKNKISTYFFGLNNLIWVSKVDLNNNEAKFNIKNNSSVDQNITFVTKIPVNVEVEILGDLNGSAGSNGKIEKNFVLKNNEEKVINFGYKEIKTSK